MKGLGIVNWCAWCLGLGGAGQTHPHPLTSTHTNLQIRRSVVSTRREDSDETEDEEEEEEQMSYVQRRQHGSPISLLHPPDAPPTMTIRVQPSPVHMHRPDLQDITQDAPDPGESSLDALNSSSVEPASSCSTSSRLTSCNNSLGSSPRGSLNSLNSVSQQYSPAGFSTAPVTVEGDTRERRKFLTPEEAARPPQQKSSVPAVPRLVEFPQTDNGSGWVRGGGAYLRSLFGLEEPVSYAGQYTLHGSSKPVKLRSSNSLRAISSYHGRAETRNSPVWYSFGRLQLAVRHRHDSSMLDMEVRQVTHLPPGREDVKIDFQLRVMPRKKWVKMVTPRNHHVEENCIASCSLKIRKVSEKSLVISGYVPGVRSHAHLALGHGIIPDLGAQQLNDEWQIFTLHLRHGIQVQDHLGIALVALSCCERVHGCLTFTVDVLHLRNMKVLRLGSKAVTSFKTKVTVWVRAVVMTKGYRAKEEELRSTPLERPKDREEHGWEAVFKNNCSTTFSVPMRKVASSCLVLEVHGRARHAVMANEALLGKVILGPEELFGGEDCGTPAFGTTAISVPGDPLDARLTHWGLTIRRKAKVEMWHRLQI